MNSRLYLRALTTFAFAGFATLPGAAIVEAQTAVGGQGTAAVVSLLGISQQLASATLPIYGGLGSATLDGAGIPGILSASGLTSITSGMPDVSTTTAQTTSELGGVSLLNGLIRADQIVAVASSYVNGSGAASDGIGSSLLGLVVNGQSIGATPAPNTRMALPGVGYVVLNEQTPTGDGFSTSGITVNMIHVVTQAPLTGLKTGEIILGSATSRVTR